MICPKHGIEMQVAKRDRLRAPLMRCPACTAEINARFAKSLANPTRLARCVTNIKQHELPPVLVPAKCL